MTAQPAGEPPQISDESRLALAFQRGEDGAYDAIYKRYAEMVRRHCERILLDPEDAQDAVQETFIRVLNRLESFNGRWLLEAWIKRIATNICLDKLRQRNRRSRESGAEALHGPALVRASEDPEHVVIRRAEVGGVLKKIKALPGLQRDAVVLRDVHDLTHRDIAAVLQISEARARVLIHRAHKAIRGSSSVGLFLSFGPRLWRKLLRTRVESTDQVTAYAYQASVHVNEFANSAGLFFKQGGSVAHGLASVAAAAVVGAGAGLPVAAPVLAENYRAFSGRVAAESAVAITNAVAASVETPAPVADGPPSLGQVTAATTAELDPDVVADAEATAEVAAEAAATPVEAAAAPELAAPAPESIPDPVPEAEAAPVEPEPPAEEVPAEAPAVALPEDVGSDSGTPAEGDGTTTDPDAEPGSEPAADPAAEPAPPSSEPSTDPSTDPVTEPTTDPVAEPSTDPSSDPTTDPSTSPTTEPSTDPSTDPTTSPSSDPSTAPSTPTGGDL